MVDSYAFRYDEPTLKTDHNSEIFLKKWQILSNLLYIDSATDGAIAAKKVFNPISAEAVVDQAIELFASSNTDVTRELAIFGLNKILIELISHKSDLGPIWEILKQKFANSNQDTIINTWNTIIKEKTMTLPDNENVKPVFVENPVVVSDQIQPAERTPDPMQLIYATTEGERSQMGHLEAMLEITNNLMPRDPEDNKRKFNADAVKAATETIVSTIKAEDDPTQKEILYTFFENTFLKPMLDNKDEFTNRSDFNEISTLILRSSDTKLVKTWYEKFIEIAS